VDNKCIFIFLDISVMEPSRLNRAQRKSLDKAGIEKHAKVHDLRHAAASMPPIRGILGKGSSKNAWAFGLCNDGEYIQSFRPRNSQGSFTECE